MQSTPRTITALFEPSQRYVVPMFQRHYVWSRAEQWEPLWSDIHEKLLENGPGSTPSQHFLGAVILDSTRKSSTKEVPKFIIIDGQQRLTTFQLMLIALRDVAVLREVTKVGRAVDRYILNADPDLMDSPEEEQFKIWPTQLNREAFCRIALARSPQRVLELFPITYGLTRTGRQRRKPEPRESLVEAYEFFVARISELCQAQPTTEQGDEMLIELLSVLRDKFTVVEIILGESDDSQEIFNSLNARGKPLSQSDLLRSYIFMRAEKSHLDRDRLFNLYWSRFEDPWWDFEARRGNVMSSRLDTLTRLLLSSKLGIPIDIRRVHAAYTGWIAAEQPYRNIEEELQAFAAYGSAFEELHARVQGPLTDFGKRMVSFENTTVFPLAIYLAVEGSMPAEDLRSALLLIESFIVRRAVCGLISNEYNKYFVELISRLRKTGANLDTLVKILAAGEGETRRFPSDEEFLSAWKTKPAYGRLSASQLSLIYRLLEIAARSQRAETLDIPLVSVEHVMPQEWTENYPIGGQLVPKKYNADWHYGPDQPDDKLRALIRRRRQALQCLGNLTVVTQPLNTAMRNASFKDKRGYFRESVLSLNRYFENVDQWDEEEIEERATHLFQYARRIWASPNSA